jgi:phosphoglycolate phosphatase
MKYKLIIFDFDGTLADSLPWFLSVINDVAAKYGFRPLDLDHIQAHRQNGLKKMIKLHGIRFWKMPFISNHVRKRMMRDAHQISLFDGVTEMIHYLHDRNVTLALVSSNSQENARRILGPGNTGRIRYFECGISVLGKQSKFRKILRKSGLLPEEVLCIGDEIRDAESAKKAGVPFGAVSWGYNSIESLQQYAPTETFYSVAEIPAKVTPLYNRARQAS